MNNEIDVLKTSLPELVKKSLLPVKFEQVVSIVNSELELESAKATVKSIASQTKDFQAYIKPIKQALDEAHKSVTDFEKNQVANGAKIKEAQEKEISDYNRRVYECQQAKEYYLRDFASVISKIEQNIAQGKVNFEARCNQILAEIELERVKSLPVPVAEKIDAIEELRIEIEKPLDIPVVPQIEIPIEKVTLKKDAKREVKTFYVKDESAAIDWCIKNNRKDLLTISLSKKAINEALKDEDFQTLNFVSYTSEWK